MLRLVPWLLLLCLGCGGDDEPLPGTYELAVSGGTDDGFPDHVVPATVELVLGEDEEGFLEVTFAGEAPSSVATITIGDQADISLMASIPVDLVDPDDCPAEWIPPYGAVELHVEGGQVDGTAEGQAYCDTASAHFVFDLSGERQ